MKIVIAPDSFKESLTALEAANAIEEGFKKVICSEVHEAHKSYIGKMGFCEENGVYVKEL